MIVTETKRRTIITMIDIDKPERFKPIDIRIPSNATSITGVLVTTTASWSNSGTVTLQAGDGADVFHVASIGEHNDAISDEALMSFSDPIVHTPWITGNIPELHPADIDGDNVLIRAWFKGADYQRPFTIRIYVQYEGAEEFIALEPEHLRRDDDEPQPFII